MRIAFLSAKEAASKGAWSGIPYHMAKALRDMGHEVDIIGPVALPRWIEQWQTFLRKVCLKLFGRDYNYRNTILISLYYGRKLGRMLRGKQYDAIVAPTASNELAFLRTRVPICYTSDATFTQLVDYYPKYTRMVRPSIWEGNYLEKRALKRAIWITFPSAWAGRSAVADYQIPEERIRIIPYGANISVVPEKDAIVSKPDLSESCDLLFLGKEWHRKGGPLAVETVRLLNNNGINARLVICGTSPKLDEALPFVTVVPFLDKNDPEQYRQFQDILLNSHFLLLPTRAECYGIVFCEASAYGIPSITTHTGGVKGVVEDGENGYTLPLDAGAKAYAALIKQLVGNPERYRNLVLSSRKKFETELNWSTWAQVLTKWIGDPNKPGQPDRTP